ncbi:MAG: phage tail protein, partial [Candidatus Dormibacteria bacterium]
PRRRPYLPERAPTQTRPASGRHCRHGREIPGITASEGTAAERVLGNGNFRVLIDGAEVGVCEISRLTSDAAGAEDEPPRVTLKRALTESKELYRWREDGDPRPVAIQQYDQAGERVVNSWLLEEAWPSRWSGPRFDALCSGIAFEELELSYARLVWLDDPEEATR